jgi:hypothetical protein
MKNTSAPLFAPGGLYVSDVSLIQTLVIFAISTFSLISIELFLEYSRFSINIMFSRMSPFALTSYYNRSFSNCLHLILNHFAIE